MAIALVVGLAMTVEAADAGKNKKKVATAVTIEDTRQDWSGEVISKRPRCERGRTVELFYVGTGGPTSYGTGQSDGDGNWVIDPEAPLPTGDYEVHASKKKFTKQSGKKIVCKVGVSPREFFSPM